MVFSPSRTGDRCRTARRRDPRPRVDRLRGVEACAWLATARRAPRRSGFRGADPAGLQGRAREELKLSVVESREEPSTSLLASSPPPSDTRIRGDRATILPSRAASSLPWLRTRHYASDGTSPSPPAGV